MTMRPPPIVSQQTSAVRELSVSSVASSNKGNASPLRQRESDRSTPRKASWSATTSPASGRTPALSAVPGRNQTSPIQLVAEGPRLREEAPISVILGSPVGACTTRRQSSPVRALSEMRPQSPLRQASCRWLPPGSSEGSLRCSIGSKSPKQSDSGSALAPVSEGAEKVMRSEIEESVRRWDEKDDLHKKRLTSTCETVKASDSVEENIQVLMKGALAAVMERQTEKTVAALQTVIERRLEEMAKRIMQVEERSSQGLAALQRVVDDGSSLEAFRESLDRRLKEVAVYVDEVVQRWSLSLEQEKQVRQDAFEATARDIDLLRNDIYSSKQAATSNNSLPALALQELDQQIATLQYDLNSTRQSLTSNIPAVALQELDSAAGKCFEQVAQLVERVNMFEHQLELQKKKYVDNSAAHAKWIEGVEEKISMGFAVEQHERRTLRLELQNAETQFAQTWEKERQEAAEIIQQGVSQLHSVLASVAMREKNKIDSQVSQQDIGSRLDEMQFTISRLEATTSLNHGAGHLQNASDFTLNGPTVSSTAFAGDLSTLEHRVDRVMASLHIAEEGCKQCQLFNSECQTRQDTLSKALNAAYQEFATLRGQSEHQHDLISELKSLQENIHEIDARCNDRFRSDSDRRRADPEPEPELIDLRRLECHQQESRLALEELQQQIQEIQGREALGTDALLCTNKDLFRNSFQDQQNEVRTIDELHARLDAISAESARCSESQTLFNSELANMCSVLRDMNGKVCELSGMAMLSPVESNSGGSNVIGCTSGRTSDLVNRQMECLVNRQSRGAENSNAHVVSSVAPPCTNAGASPNANNSPLTRYGVPPLRLTRMSQ